MESKKLVWGKLGSYRNLAKSPILGSGSVTLIQEHLCSLRRHQAMFGSISGYHYWLASGR